MRPPENFRFEPACAHVDWAKVAGTNVARIQRRGDAEALRGFIGEVAMGHVDDGEMRLHPSHAKVFQLLQLQTQYLLFCHQTLRERSVEVDQALKKLHKKRTALQRQALARKERVRTLAADAQAQENMLASYHAMLEVADPELAARVAVSKDGQLVLLEPQAVLRQRPATPEGSDEEASREGEGGSEEEEDEEETSDADASWSDREQDPFDGASQSTFSEDGSVRAAFHATTPSKTLPRANAAPVELSAGAAAATGGAPLSPLRWRGVAMPVSAARLDGEARNSSVLLRSSAMSEPPDPAPAPHGADET